MAKILTVTLNPALDCSVFCPSFALYQVNRSAAVLLSPGRKGINVATSVCSVNSELEISVAGFFRGSQCQPV